MSKRSISEINNDDKKRRVVVKYSDEDIPDTRIYHTVVEPLYDWEKPYPLKGNTLFKVYVSRIRKWFDFKTFHLSIFYMNHEMRGEYNNFIVPHLFEKTPSEHAKERRLPEKWCETAFLICSEEYKLSVWRMIVFDLLRKKMGSDMAMIICSHLPLY